MVSMSPDETTDVAVVGGGPGGYVAAIRAAQLDLNVTLVEREAVGGTCLNHGCIPSKALISATGVAQHAREAEHIGVHADPAFDLSEAVDWKDGVVNQLTDGVKTLCKGNGVDLLAGTATFLDDSTLHVHRDGDDLELEFGDAILATGSRPIELPGFGFDGEHVLSSRNALALKSVPERLLVIGAGYIGMELSSVFAMAGSDVTVVGKLDEPLPMYDNEITDVVQSQAEDLGIDFHFGQRASDLEVSSDDVTVTAEAEDGSESQYLTDKVLVAVGREPVTDTVDLAAAGLKTDENGFVPTDEQAQTPVDGIYAVGDVASEPMLAHEASAEGEVAAETIAGKPARLNHNAIPAAVFTHPEIGSVGMTADEAKAAGFEPVVSRFGLQANGRALTRDASDGFVRIVADAETEFILGAQIVAPEASELIAELGLAIEMGTTLEDLASTVHTHPTLSQAVMEAAAAADGEAIHTMN